MATGLARFIEILNLFEGEHPSWTVQQIADRLDVPGSTTYRLVRELLAAGFLDHASEARYRLGPAFLEYERRLRLTDPLIRVGADFLDEFALQVRLPCVVVLARLYGDRVVCAADAKSPGERISTSYERGRPMPLTRGATSKAILALLPSRRLDRILRNAYGQDGAVSERKSMQGELSMIRKRGYVVTRGEVDASLMGIAAPISDEPHGVAASLSIIASNATLDAAEERRLVPLLVSAASVLRDQISRLA